MEQEYGNEPVVQFNHVNLGDQFESFGHWDPHIDRLICLAELGSAESPFYKHALDQEPLFRSALQSGWHVAPSIGIDNMLSLDAVATLGEAATRHTGIWVTGSGRLGVMEALRARRVFASEVADVSLRFRVKTLSDGVWHWMGETIKADPAGVMLYVDASDPTNEDHEQFVENYLMSSASITKYIDFCSTSITSVAFSQTLKINDLLATAKTTLDQTCLYVRLKQKDGDYFYSAPIWIKYWTAVSGTISEDTTWSPDNNPYLVKGQVTVASGATLTIQPGTIVKFADSSSGITVNGHMLAQGSLGSPVYFTSYRDDTVGGDTNYDGSITSPGKGDWNQVCVSGIGATETFDNCVFRYGGSYWPQANLAVRDGGAACVTNSSSTLTYGAGIHADNASLTTSGVDASDNYYGVTLLNCTGLSVSGVTAANCSYGLYAFNCSSPTFSGNTLTGNGTGIVVSSCTSPTLTNNTFTSNSRSAEIRGDISGTVTSSGNTASGTGIRGILLGLSPYFCTINADTQLRASDGFPYVPCVITVPAGKTLTIAPGVVMKCWGDSDCNINVSGSIIAHGTPSAPIYFTSMYDDSIGGDTTSDGNASSPNPGNWRKIGMSGAGANGSFDYCVLRYGGSYSGDAPGTLSCKDGAALSVNNSTVTMSYRDGIYSTTPDQVIKNCIIAYNAGNGVYLTGGSAQVTYCNLYSNGGNSFGNGTLTTGTIYSDPKFVSLASGDYQLQTTSPCIDAGDPAMYDSDGSRVDMGALPLLLPVTLVTVKQAKTGDAGLRVSCGGAIVSAAFTDFFYIEADDRSCGIRVEKPSNGLAPGVRVDVVGTVQTNGNEERFIAATIVKRSGTGSVTPLFMNCGTIGGADWQYSPIAETGQCGVTGGTGLNNIGLLVKICGKFTYVDTHTFTIDDGSGVNLKCVVPDGVPLNRSWNYVSVTGISSCEPVGSEVHRRLLVRTQNDIQSY